jgi:hypothetical protein
MWLGGKSPKKHKKNGRRKRKHGQNSTPAVGYQLPKHVFVLIWLLTPKEAAGGTDVRD